jgi:MYXO-CTERM domain-containing protein
MKPKLLLVLAIAMACLPTVLAHGGPLRSTDLAPGKSWAYFADEVKVISYHCHQHPTMGGELSITATGPRQVNISIVDYAFAPAKATVRYGGIVNWTNDGAMVHSVEENSTTHHPTTGGNSPTVGVAAVGLVLVAAAWAVRRR